LLGSGALAVWVDHTPGCTPTADPVCPQQVAGGSPFYFLCFPKGDPDELAKVAFLHVKVQSGDIFLGAFVLRTAGQGNDTIVTVYGQADVELDEADVVVPRKIVLWNTVLP
jgi:hypothetical protein